MKVILRPLTAFSIDLAKMGGLGLVDDAVG
jgi:hypothetical protein